MSAVYLVETRHSTYRVELGEGLEVLFRRVVGKPFVWSELFADRDYRGVLAHWPLSVGDSMRIFSAGNKWPDDERELNSSPITALRVADEDAPSLQTTDNP